MVSLVRRRDKYHMSTIITTIQHAPSRTTHQVSLRETFSIKTGDTVDDAGNLVPKDVLVTAFTEPGPLTPQVDPYFRFPPEELVQFLMALEAKDTTYLLGHSGTGKTALATQVAARLNYNLVQLNFDGHLHRSDLVGDWKIAGGEMVFRHGLVPLAFQQAGTILLLDEVDACPPETAFVLQRALSSDRKFLMHETNELFELHPQNCIVGTANTNGMGDESSLYMAGTNIQNFSFLNRWQTVIQVDYMSPVEEQHMLSTMFASAEVASFVKPVTAVLGAARDAYKSGTLSVPLTTRDGINWLTKIARLPLPMKAARHSFLDKLPTQDALAIGQVIARHFRISDKDDHKYLIVGKR